MQNDLTDTTTVPPSLPSKIDDLVNGGDGHQDFEDTAWKLPSAEEIREELSGEFTEEQKEKAWVDASEAVRTYHDGLVRRWKEEMDTLLVYAGLFSAVLTAFNVQSYQLLQPDPQDPTITMLRVISAQLESFTISPPFVNATHMADAHSTLQPSFQPPTSAVWLNTLWFSSLVFSLASASIALFVKQWLHEVTVQGASRQSARLRQYRLNGLLKWHVGTVVVALPIMLQLAAVLFLIGLLVLLWTLHRTVAVVISSLITALFAFLLTVIVLPVFRSDCSYRSPASLVLYDILRHTRNATMRPLRRFARLLCRCVDNVHPKGVYVRRLKHFAYRWYKLEMPTWLDRDQRRIHERASALDRAIITTAYTTTFDARFASYMPMVFTDLPPDQVATCFRDMASFEREHWGLRQDPNIQAFLVMYGLRHMLTRTDKDSPSWREDIPFVSRHLCLPLGTSANQRFSELACRTLCHLSAENPSDRYYYKSANMVLTRMYGDRGARHSFDSLCHVKAMIEKIMEVDVKCADFEGFRKHSLVAQGVLLCIHEAASGRAQLSPTQAHTMLVWGRQALARIHQWLGDQEWRGLHAGCLAHSGDTRQTVLAFPHIASGHLVKDFIDPLLDVCSTQAGLELVSEDLVSAIEHAWSSIQSAYPFEVDVDDVDFIWCSGAEVIDARLAELRAAVVGRVTVACRARKRIVHPL